MKDFYQTTIDNISAYLMHKSRHNTAARIMDGSSSIGFVSEILTRDRRIWLKIRVDDKINFVMIEAFPGISVAQPYRGAAAMFCMHENDSSKVGNLVIDPDTGDIYCHVESSIKDAPLSGETIEKLEGIAVSSLLGCIEDLERVAHGQVVPSTKGRVPALRSMLEDLERLIEKRTPAHRPDIPEGIGDIPLPEFPDLPEFPMNTLGDDD